MADLNEQYRQRRQLQDRQYHQQDMAYLEARRLDLAMQIERNKAELARVEQDLATVLGRLDRIEEILELREMFTVEAVPCSVDRPGARTCPGCCVCLSGTGV